MTETRKVSSTRAHHKTLAQPKGRIRRGACAEDVAAGVVTGAPPVLGVVGRQDGRGYFDNAKDPHNRRKRRGQV